MKKRSKGFYVSLCVSALVLGIPAHAQTLQTVDIEAAKLITPTKQANESVYTGTEVTSKGIELQGAKASTSVYESIAALLGVNVETADSTGLNAEQSNVRIRGVSNSLGAMSVEGIPNYGLGPIGGRDYIYDMGNMESVSVYKGGVPSDIGTGVGSRGGAIALHPKWAQKEFGFDLAQSIGSNDYTKSYFRLDSGILNESGTRFSTALSYAKADKWRGEGELGPRANGNISLVQPLGEKGMMKVWYNHNEHEQHYYKALSYANIKSNYKADYGTNPANSDYYAYNKGEFKNDDLLAIFSYAFDDIYTLNFKPYYSKEDSYTSYASSGGKVQKRPRDFERYGAITELEAKLSNVKMAIGYHYENATADIVSMNYTPTVSGLTSPVLAGIAAAGTSYVHSPYIKFSGKNDALKWQAGLKYFEFQDSDVRDSSDSMANRLGKDYTLYLPTLGFSYEIDSAWELYANYGKNFIRPYSYAPLVNYYKQNKAAFTAVGMSAQDLFDGYTTEESQTIDLGFRYKGEMVEIAPTLFFGKHKNLLVGIKNDQNTSLQYQQNVGEASSYGVETEINLFINNTTTLFVNPTYTHFTYDSNIKGMATKDNQVVDVPKWMVRSGLIYKIGNFELVPMVRYLGDRYGNATNTEKVDDVWLADFRAVYTQKNFYQKSTLTASLDVNNIFDKEYISVINASDDTLSALGTAYYQGAPRSAMLTVGVHF